MDWLIDSTAADPARALDLLGDHLRRHAADPESVDAALEQLEGTLAGALEAAEGRPVRAHLDWTRTAPALRLVALRDELPTDDDVVLDAPVPARHRSAVQRLDVEPLASTPLAVDRASREVFVAGPPPTVGVAVDPAHGMAAVPVAMAAVHETHPGLDASQVASAAGALIAEAALEDGNSPLDPRGAAEAIAEVHRALGSDAHVVTATDDVLEVAVGRCPFGDSPGASSLCHVSTGVAGQLAARVHGRAAVILDESVAAGDPECHLQVVLREVDGVDGETHVWPPTVVNPVQISPQFDLSVSLPREGGSVPVVRRLAGQALRAFGVCDSDVDDVQLAITEACANVIDHAADTDTYDVKVELAADHCAITVVDKGGGFDAGAVPARPDDESGSGRGLMLMRALVDNVKFTNEPQAGAVVHMVKALTYDQDHPLHRR